ncbi:MAG TPA: hypothetical protein EYH31_08230 [Anaerolineae bacterium]|nr:hypothetical protein [Anaerolineae bacterium]
MAWASPDPRRGEKSTAGSRCGTVDAHGRGVAVLGHDYHPGERWTLILRSPAAGAWLRRLTHEHRIVYLVSEDRVDFLQARYHY